ncbi:hypothetical protein [Paenibacillus sp. NFR01]|uniref:hypothetical protein n=1 Tax=Paenibacillus sp. NFR01 TaxID=1566279 RepID=UPI0008CEB324|nr:hypothetical protein [Paenibacillus sp. NFR01]SEU20654.1 hypothetical protein SAMN03159358_4005 [Paenibacillus sp. NFR01]
MTYFESAHGSVAWDESLKSVKVEWNGFSYGEGFQEILLRSADLLMLKQGSKVLMDIRKGSVIKEEDKAWMADVFVKHIYQSGLRLLAMVEPGSVLAKMSVNRTIDGLGSLPYRQTSFTDVKEAERWLASTEPALAVS